MTQIKDNLFQVNQRALDFIAKGTKQLFIAGEWVSAQSGKTFETINPATEEVLASVAEADEKDVDDAVKAAKKALNDPNWAAISPDSRTSYLLKLASLVSQNIDELAAIESLDTGMPLGLSAAITASTVQLIEYYAGWTTKVYGKTNPSDASIFSYTRREPLGVIGAIIPWNIPLFGAIQKIVPALATGNTVVLKPAENTPVTALRLAELIKESGLPNGVVNIITGYGAVAGAAMGNHPDINKISFTGSVATGRKLLISSAEDFKNVTLELGGKSPFIIFDDADIDKAVQNAVIGFTSNSGQMCVASTRILIQENIFEEVSKKIAQLAASIKIGDPFDPETQIGPLASEGQLKRVNDYVKIGLKEGAQILNTSACDMPKKGYYTQPVVFTNVTKEMRIYREEIFGPVTTLTSFKDEADAIEKANDSEFGLAAGLWTQNLSRVHRVSSAIQAGSIWVNSFFEASPITPFGGYKKFGIGKEFGEESIDAFTQIKSIVIRL